MKWHTSAICLSDKSNALGLLRFLSIAPIRDEIMHWLSPMDTVQFVIATGILFSESDMARYTSVFNYFISNRRWLSNKLVEGYRFTIMGSGLAAIMDENIGSCNDAQASMWRLSRMSTSTRFLLFVTKDDHFVPCTEEFMPPSIFTAPTSSSGSSGDETSHLCLPPRRMIHKTWDAATIEIITLLSDQRTTSPLFIYSDLLSSVAGLIDRRELMVSGDVPPEMRYAHASISRVMIGPRIYNESDHNTRENAANLFSIKTAQTMRGHDGLEIADVQYHVRE